MLDWLILGGAVLFGFLIGRWWALVVPLLYTAIAFNAEPEGANDLIGAALAGAAFLTICVAIGVILRKRKDSSGRRWHPPA